MRVDPGKRFERKFKESLCPQTCFVMRIADKILPKFGRIISEQSEADFLVTIGDEVFLVECKATNRSRLEFYNVKEHQEDSLRDFDSRGKHTHGILAVEFYNKESYSKPKRMFLVDIGAWLAFKESTARSSMPISHFELIGVECPYTHGRYSIDFSRWCV